MNYSWGLMEALEKMGFHPEQQVEYQTCEGCSGRGCSLCGSGVVEIWTIELPDQELDAAAEKFADLANQLGIVRSVTVGDQLTTAHFFGAEMVCRWQHSFSLVAAARPADREPVVCPHCGEIGRFGRWFVRERVVILTGQEEAAAAMQDLKAAHSGWTMSGCLTPGSKTRAFLEDVEDR